MMNSFDMWLREEIESTLETLANKPKTALDEYVYCFVAGKLAALKMGKESWDNSIEKYRAMTHLDNGAIDHSPLTEDEIAHALKLENEMENE